MIRVEGLFHHYSGKPILDGVSFDVRPGEIVVVMGPNGSGKSTLLGCVGGAITPIAGKVWIESHLRYSSVDEELAARGRLVYLPYSLWVPVGRTPRQWLYAVGKTFGSEDRAVVDHVDRLLGLFDLQSVGNSLVSSLSSGQRKKVELCAALVSNAPVMVLDEPFSGGLDPSGLTIVKSLLRHLARVEKRTVLVSSPVPELVEEVADRIMILKDSKISALGTPAELRAQVGSGVGLDDVYARLTSPDTEGRLATYLENRSGVTGR